MNLSDDGEKFLDFVENDSDFFLPFVSVRTDGLVPKKKKRQKHEEEMSRNFGQGLEMVGDNLTRIPKRYICMEGEEGKK